MKNSNQPVSTSCLAVCPICGSSCQKPYHGDTTGHECPNGHISKTTEGTDWKS